MKYLCLIYADEKMVGTMTKAESDAFMGEYFAFTEAIRKSGHLLGGEALQPVHTATTVRVRNGKMSTTDGPFAETKEQLGGYYLIEAQDLNEAIQVASRIPSARAGEHRGPADLGGTSPSRREPLRVSEDAAEPMRDMVEAVYRSDSRRVLATLIRLLGDFDLAEEALHEAFAAAVEQWPRDGVPANPRAWLVSTGRFKAIDGLRRRARFDAVAGGIWPSGSTPTRRARRMTGTTKDVEDDRLRLIFTCCHPALPPDAQVALTLREVCGLTTEEIARAFLTSAPTRGPADRARQGEDPGRAHPLSGAVAGRPAGSARHGAARGLPGVQRGVLRVFRRIADAARSLGGGDPAGTAPGRAAARSPRSIGLLALMLLHESRRAARTSPTGELVLLDEQDRSLWNREQIAEGTALVERALSSRRFGPYTLQAAIAAVHAEAPTAAATDWAQIVGPVRRAAARRSVAGRRAEPRGGGCHARRPGGGPRADRRDPGARAI